LAAFAHNGQNYFASRAGIFGGIVRPVLKVYVLRYVG
jgi:hypothetical protein